MGQAQSRLMSHNSAKTTCRRTIAVEWEASNELASIVDFASKPRRQLRLVPPDYAPQPSSVPCVRYNSSGDFRLASFFSSTVLCPS